MRFSKFSSILVLCLCVFVVIVATEESSAPQWICNSLDRCVENDASNIVDSIHFESQHDCRMSCGKYGAIWPAPTGATSISKQRVHFDPWKVRFNVVAPSPATIHFIRETNRIFIGNILKECLRNCSLSDSKEIFVKTTVNSSSLALDWKTDESYTLTIGTTDRTYVDIRANTVYGARHAFETFSNLVTGSQSTGLLMVYAAQITDAPKFPHRGVLLDTARNYMPLRRIRSTLDAMAASKLNVFHWHVVDTHSFPLEITRVPQMQRYGAYSADQVYSQNDALNIIKYARLRGIRVLIEIDGPSHAGNGWQWGPEAGMGNMSVCINVQPWRNFCVQSPCGQLNPVNENMYKTMKDIYEDVAEISAPEETIHMGGDEVYIPCWNRTEEITKELKQRGFDLSTKSFLKLWSQFHERNLKSWDEVKKSQFPESEPQNVIIWSSHLTDADIIEEYLPKDRFIIQTWVDSTDPVNQELLKKGYKLILSTKDAWYLDHGFWGRTRYYNWATAYNNRMPAGDGVLGGETCMWSEFVDENSVEPRIWPRAGAASERLWTNPKTSALVSQTRFYRYRDRLIARGIKPDAVIPKWCVLNEGQCL